MPAAADNKDARPAPRSKQTTLADSAGYSLIPSGIERTYSTQRPQRHFGYLGIPARRHPGPKAPHFSYAAGADRCSICGIIAAACKAPTDLDSIFGSEAEGRVSAAASTARRRSALRPAIDWHRRQIRG